MPEITLVLPEGLKRRFEGEAEKQGKTLEELVVEVFSEAHGVDSGLKTELYSELCERYLKEAADFLDKEDYQKASGKAWGAATQIIKAVATKRGINIKSPSELYGFVAVLKTELKDPELTRLLGVAGALHQNFKEGWLPPEVVTDYAEAVIRFIEKLKEMV